MNKIWGYALSIFCWFNANISYATVKYELLPDLPEPIAAANASSISKVSDISNSAAPEPNFLSVLMSLIFVILLIYLTGIIYTKLNKLNTNALKQNANLSKNKVAIISTTSLGNNKSLHVIELNGKRMLIGATPASVQLIKDMGNITETGEEESCSHIEIPEIKIPKIEIPKIEIPGFDFSKIMTKIHKKDSENTEEDAEENTESPVEYDNNDEIIEHLFEDEEKPAEPEVQQKNEHCVDPDDFALYKKYLK